MQMNIAEAKAKLSELIAAAERGDEVVIARGGQPVVRLVPVARLMPPEGASEARRRAAWCRIEALRSELGARDWTPGEVLSARDEGRR